MKVQVDWDVAFAKANGDVVVAIVEKVWERQPTDPTPPLINVRERQSGVRHTSVPHKADVVGAAGFFYT